MKVALITTTVNIPTVLQLYRACSPDVRFFVAGDRKTPEEAINLCQYDISNCDYLFEQDQSKWKCSDLIGWNTIARRNIALLEALKWGAEIIVTIDDDNIPLSMDYFDRFEMVLASPNKWEQVPTFSGIEVTGFSNWFDVGSLLVPEAPHRGFPTDMDIGFRCNSVTNSKVGVAAGICLGDPDISAVERIANHPIVHGLSELLRAGIVVNPNTKTVFNSQNTAFLRELAPCFLMCPQFGRHDDIYASLIAQRVMRETGHVVHFGQPFVWQQRNSHNLLRDLAAEQWGAEHILQFAELLDHIVLPSNDVFNSVYIIWDVLENATWMPEGVVALGKAWLEDVRKVL